MIKTLRLTSVAAVILAGLVLASVLGPTSLLGLGVPEDEPLEKTLDGPSAVDRFKEQHGDRAPSGRDTTPPLVKQAELFAAILNPPANTALPSQKTFVPVAKKPKLPVSSSARFTIEGLSYCPSDPMQSFAFLRLVDGTHRWVQPGDEIGHHVIRAVKGNSVVCWDGNRETEIPMELPPDTAGLLETGSGSDTAATSSKPTITKVSRSSATGRGTSSARLTPNDQKRLSDLLSRIKQAGADPAARAKLISEYQSSRVSPQEAEKLDDLGKKVSSDSTQAKQGVKSPGSVK